MISNARNHGNDNAVRQCSEILGFQSLFPHFYRDLQKTVRILAWGGELSRSHCRAMHGRKMMLTAAALKNKSGASFPLAAAECIQN